MKRMITAVLAAFVFLALPSVARANDTGHIIFALNFEGITVGDEVDGYYGPGIHFTDGFIANGDYGPPCYFGGDGPCSAQLTSDSVVMDVYPGFELGLGFYYNNSDGSTQMFIYDGSDGTGALLTGGPLPPGGGPPGDWAPYFIGFDGTAYSVIITGGPGIEFTTLSGGYLSGPIPEPASLILLTTGIAGLVGWRRLRYMACLSPVSHTPESHKPTSWYI